MDLEDEDFDDYDEDRATIVRRRGLKAQGTERVTTSAATGAP
jgi:hypothetical protein